MCFDCRLILFEILSSPCTVPVTLSLSLSLSARGCGLYVHCLFPCVLRKHQSLSSFVRPSVVPSFRFPVQRPSFVSNNLESTQPHYSILNLLFPPHSLRCSRTKTIWNSLPGPLRQSETPTTFKRQLKPFLFSD